MRFSLAGKAVRKKKPRRDGKRRGAGPFSEAESSFRRRLWTSAARTAALSLLVIGLFWGIAQLEGHVHAFPRYDRRLALDWQNLPHWLQRPENKHILQTLTRTADLRLDDHLLDEKLSERLGAALADPSVGWVKSVDRVVMRPNGRIAVDCRFRRPAAWVRLGEFCYLVDGDGIRLPGRYAPEQCGGGSLLFLTGVEAPPPGVGGPWPGADLTAGLKLASLVSQRPFSRQVQRIIVFNHDGREDRDRPHLELATDRPGSRIWWGRPPNEEYGTEINAGQKLALLDRLYQQWGRIDLNRAYVDVRTYPDSVALPSATRRWVQH